MRNITPVGGVLPEENYLQVTGAGIKIGIISTSFNATNQLSNDLANGELSGGATNTRPIQILKDLTPDNPAANDEGRAIAQIIHDIAPDAEFVFHTSIGDNGIVDDVSYSKAIAALVAVGANIIVEDAIVRTSIFENGVAAQAAQTAIDTGAVVIAATGNNGQIAYASDYRSDGQTFELGGKIFEALDFDASADVDLFQDIRATKNGSAIFPLLTWSEPNADISNNLEMFLVNSPHLPSNSGDNLLAVSGPPTPSSVDYPLKSLIYSTAKDQTSYLVIGRELNGATAPEQIKWISTANGLDRTTQYEYVNSTPADQGASTIFGVANLPEVIAVGAVEATPAGAIAVRSYSSRDSSPLLFDEDGTRRFPQQPIIKPDILAPDGVSTTVAGFEDFQGTSAAAPYVAGVVALMEQAAGGSGVLSPQEISEILKETAIPLNIASAISDENITNGLINANAAIALSRDFGHGSTSYLDDISWCGSLPIDLDRWSYGLSDRP